MPGKQRRLIKLAILLQKHFICLTSSVKLWWCQVGDSNQLKENQSNNLGSNLKMLPITHNFLLLPSDYPWLESDKPACAVVNAQKPTVSHQKQSVLVTKRCTYLSLFWLGPVAYWAWPNKQILVKLAVLQLFSGMWKPHDDRLACGTVVLIVFLCTSSAVSHCCVQTRDDVYSAETSKSTALGCNLVTSFSLLLPAPLTSSLGPAVPPAHRLTAFA